MPITATESEFLNVFGVEPTRQEADSPWPFNDFLYEVSQEGLSISCSVSPGYKDIRVTVTRGDARLYELNAVGVTDIRCRDEDGRGVLEIVLNDELKVLLGLRPALEIHQDFTGEN